ncbi:uncharacterized protein LOC113124868 [Mastacembelus armatus]|uniref:uncharacterized protein LOC113124868 n=1 Tax=Mastacembelus armatus TaxID=205130 RepID=UPI000E458276|nr:uncharacterized protein LOC113124868 [Mastacembelus armatus]
MKLLMTNLLLTFVLARSSLSGSSDTLVVTQTPNVSVMEGGTVNISCCWTGSGESQRLRVIWLKNLMEIKNEAVNLTSPPVKKERNDCWNLTFSSVTKEATGRYICRVTAEIPVLASASGSGTVLTVTSRGNTVTSGAPETPQEDVLIHVLRCLPLFALVITFIYLYHSGTKALQHRPAAPGNKPLSAQRTKEDQVEEKRDEGETESEENDQISDD